MRLFLPPLEIGDEEGFTASNDIFGRQAVGDGLTNLITTIEQPLVIALNAQWGSGKTTFLRMWSSDLRRRGFGVVFFDAFENDYIDDAFAAIAGQIVTLARDKRKENDGRFKNFAEKAIAAGRVLTRSGVKLGVKIGTLGILDTDDMRDAAKDVSADLANLTDKHIGELLTKQREQKAVIDEFREALADLPSLLANNADDADTESENKLVVIIDELDRCRPDFALQLLEKIKHFFSVPNVHFVLGVHLGQLENSVSSLYGTGLDSRTYLQKFISLTVLLSHDDPIADIPQTSIYCKYLTRAHGLTNDGNEFFAWYIARVARAKDFSLRTIEKIYSTIAITIAFSSDRTFRPVPLVAGLAILRVVHPALFDKAKSGTLIYKEIHEPLYLTNLNSDPSEFNFTRWVNVWKYITYETLNQEDTGSVSRLLEDYFIEDKRRALPFIANRVMDRFLPPPS